MPAAEILNVHVDYRQPRHRPQSGKSWNVMSLCVMGVRGGKNFNNVTQKH